MCRGGEPVDLSRFDDFGRAVKDGAEVIARDLFGELRAQAVADARDFLSRTRGDLRAWTALLARRELTRAEFGDLVKGQRELARLHALTRQGVELARLERFRVRFINLVIRSAFREFRPGGTGRRG